MNRHFGLPLLLTFCLFHGAGFAEDSALIKAAREVEKAYVETIKKALPAFVFLNGGSGVLISADGLVLTNHHVIRDEKAMLVRNNSREYVAVTLGIDPQGDIALLKLKDASGLKGTSRRELVASAASLKDVSGMQYLELADSDKLRVGQQVFAIGNPFDTAEFVNDPTVTTGVISALHRFEANYRDAIQTDASINPGNSGGPLITLDGKLAGINGLIETRYGNAANTGVALAIPSRQIERFLPSLKTAQGKAVTHGYINGIKGGYDAADETLRDGAYIANVTAGSPAEKIGLKPGDKIVKIDDYPLLNFIRLIGVLSTYPAGDTIKVTYKRGTELTTVDAKLEPMPENDTTAYRPRRRQQPGETAPKIATGKLGIEIKDATSKDPATRTQPAIISKVDEDSAAKKVGLEVGDLVLEVNGESVKNIFQFKMVMRNSGLNPGDKLKMKIRRGADATLMDLIVEATLQ